MKKKLKLATVLFLGVLMVTTLSLCKKKKTEDTHIPDYSIIFNPNLTYGSITDSRDNVVYKTIQIGTQTWMAENLKAKKYRDGTAITNITDNTQWASATTEAYCDWSHLAPSGIFAYGLLYNWYAVSDSHGICPAGWHVPSDTEWNTLVSFLGGKTTAGIKLKEVGKRHWGTDVGADNSSGFTGLPGGDRHASDGVFYVSSGNWWTSTDCTIFQTTPESKQWLLHSGDIEAKNYCEEKNFGFSVRCIQD